MYHVTASPLVIRALLCLLPLLLCPALQAAPLKLDAEEIAFLQQHPSLRLGVDHHWPPFEFVDEGGGYRGMGAEYIDLIEQRLGVSMVPEIGLSWSEVLEKARNKELDILPAVMSTPPRQAYLNFTHPHLTFPMVIIGRNNGPNYDNLEELRGKRVGIVKGYITEDILAGRHPSLQRVPFETIQLALTALSTGNIDVFVGNLAAISHAIEEMGLTNLKVAGQTPYDFQLGIGVRNDWPEMVTILQKALDSISEEEAAQIRERWVRLQFEQGIDLYLLLLYGTPIGAALLGVLLFILFTNRKLQREIEQRKLTESRLRESEQALLDSQQVAHIGSWNWELGDNHLEWSEESYNIAGRMPHQPPVTVEEFMDFIHADDRVRMQEAVDEVLESGRDHFSLEYRGVRKDGEVRYLKSYGRLYRSTNGQPLRFSGVVHDITEQKQQELALQEKQQTLQTILDNAPIGIWLLNGEGRMLFVNQAFCQSVGIPEEQFLATSHYAELLGEKVAASCLRSDAEALLHEGPHISFEQLQFTDGKPHDLEVIKVRLNDTEGNINGLIGLSMDVTDKLRAEANLRYKAFYDELTGLANRGYLMEQLDKALASARRRGHYSALLFFDLDNFKIINDTLGHSTGDRLLKEIGARLKETTRLEDTAARLGGDEFVVIANALGTDEEQAAEHARQIAEKLRQTLSLPYELDGHEHHLTLSIGINMFPIGEQDLDDLLKQADTAMYRAKESGRDAVSFFLPSMQQATEERFQLQTDLRRAITEAQFSLHFQPQVDSDGRLIGAETLLRWHHPQRGMVSPAHFIPVAEDSGQILALGNWVLEQACRQLRHWSDCGTPLDTLSVNVSPRQFHQSDFVEQVEQILRDTGADPLRLELELTENILVDHLSEVSEKMTRLRSLGVRFAIDDFGTGYSSLGYLKRLPLDRLKIDQSFIRDITRDEGSARIVETIIAMARHLKLDVIAEGVEEENELAFLQEKGCYHYQGYYFSRPLELEAFNSWLRGQAA